MLPPVLTGGRVFDRKLLQLPHFARARKKMSSDVAHLLPFSAGHSIQHRVVEKNGRAGRWGCKNCLQCNGFRGEPRGYRLRHHFSVTTHVVGHTTGRFVSNTFAARRYQMSNITVSRHTPSGEIDKRNILRVRLAKNVRWITSRSHTLRRQRGDSG